MCGSGSNAYGLGFRGSGPELPAQIFGFPKIRAVFWDLYSGSRILGKFRLEVQGNQVHLGPECGVIQDLGI